MVPRAVAAASVATWKAPLVWVGSKRGCGGSGAMKEVVCRARERRGALGWTFATRKARRGRIRAAIFDSFRDGDRSLKQWKIGNGSAFNPIGWRLPPNKIRQFHFLLLVQAA